MPLPRVEKERVTVSHIVFELPLVDDVLGDVDGGVVDRVVESEVAVDESHLLGVVESALPVDLPVGELPRVLVLSVLPSLHLHVVEHRQFVLHLSKFLVFFRLVVHVDGREGGQLVVIHG